MRTSSPSKGTRKSARTLTRQPASGRPAPEQHLTTLVHVPLRGVGCAAIPRSDLSNQDHFIVWSRFYASYGPAFDLWNNAGWRGAARPLFRDDLQAISDGDRAALVRVLVSLPQALALPECQLAFADVLTKRDSPALRALEAEARKRKALRPNARQIDHASRVRENLNIENYRRLFGSPRRGKQTPSFRGAVESLTGQVPETDTRARRLSEGALNGFDRERTLYRVDHDVGRCLFHADTEDKLLPDPHSDRPTRDPSCPGIEDPEAVPRRRNRQRRPQPDLHLIAGVDG
jgi:hypothetical protein